MPQPVSKKNFLDFIDKARLGDDQHKPVGQKDKLEERFNKVLTAGATPEQLLAFFQKEGYADITMDECAQMINITNNGNVDFHQQAAQKY